MKNITTFLRQTQTAMKIEETREATPFTWEAVVNFSRDVATTTTLPAYRVSRVYYNGTPGIVEFHRIKVGVCLIPVTNFIGSTPDFSELRYGYTTDGGETQSYDFKINLNYLSSNRSYDTNPIPDMPIETIKPFLCKGGLAFKAPIRLGLGEQLEVTVSRTKFITSSSGIVDQVNVALIGCKPLI